MADWTCFKCGKKGRKTIDQLIDDGWTGFDLTYKLKGGQSKRIRKFSCRDHKEEFSKIAIETWKTIEAGRDPIQERDSQ